MDEIGSLKIIYAVTLLFRFAQFLLEVPTVRMVEYAVCHQTLASNMGTSLDEMLCKGEVVQRQVSEIVGWKMSFDAIPSLLSIVYFGGFASQHGRKLMLTLCCLGYLLAVSWVLLTCYFYDFFPISTVLISSVFLFIGGGPLVFVSVAAAVVSDRIGTSSRTRYLFLLSACSHLDKLISPPVVTGLLARSMYLPSVVSGAMLVVCVVLLRLQPRAQPRGYSSDTQRLLQEDVAGMVPGSSISQAHATKSGPEQAGQASRYPLIASIIRVWQRFERAVTYLYRKPMLIFCYFAFILKSNGMASEAFVFQYLSEKFKWPLQDTTILRFALSSGAVIATMGVGPLAGGGLARRGFSVSTIELGIARLSTVGLTICFLIAWRARSSLVFILSMFGAGLCEGLEPALLGLLSTQACSTETGSLFAFAYMCGSLGDMTGGPLMSALISVGRSAQQASSGYCFLASSVIFGTIGILSYVSRPLSEQEQVH